MEQVAPHLDAEWVDPILDNLTVEDEPETTVMITKTIGSGRASRNPPAKETPTKVNHAAASRAAISQDAGMDVDADITSFVADWLPSLLVALYQVLAYYVPVAPETSRKDKKTVHSWVTFYTPVKALACQLATYRLRFYDASSPYDDGELIFERRAVAVDAWAKAGRDPVSGQELWQVKLPFAMPAETYDLRVFKMVLVHIATGATIELGGSSLVSNTSQRQLAYNKIHTRFPDETTRLLMRNFSTHPPGRRHFRNGKGTGQGSVTGGRFRVEELSMAVPLMVTFPKGSSHGPSSATPSSAI